MYQLLLHKTLTPEKWSRFGRGQQLLMIGNELNRLINGLESNLSEENLRECMDRVFELTDLTICCSQKGGFLKEVLRFREIFAEAYAHDQTELFEMKNVFEKLYRALLACNSDSAKIL